MLREENAVRMLNGWLLRSPSAVELRALRPADSSAFGSQVAARRRTLASAGITWTMP